MNSRVPIWKLDEEKLQKRLETAKEVTRKRDKTGGGYLSEFEYCRHIELNEPCSGLFALYNLAFARGYKRGREDAKKQYRKKTEIPR